MKNRSPHVGCRPGKRVRLVLRDGSRVEGRFKDCNDRWIDLDTGRVQRTCLKSFIVLKGPDHRGQ